MKNLAVTNPNEMDWKGYEPIAVIKLEPDELSSELDLSFRENYDDLDRLLESTFRGPHGNVFALVRYLHSPTPGTELLIKASTPADARRQLREAMSGLLLSEEDISWVSPTLGTTAIAKRKARARRRSVSRKAAGSRRSKARKLGARKSKKKKRPALKKR